MLELRDYQRRSLDALESYLRLAVRHGAKTAFVLQTERPYRAVPQLPALPYICLRIPTGGGKTLMACHALGIVTKEYLQAERAVCLWLVPSNTIRDQTLAALRDRRHPYRQAVDAHFGGLVTVMDLTEALYVFLHGSVVTPCHPVTAYEKPLADKLARVGLISTPKAKPTVSLGAFLTDYK